MDLGRQLGNAGQRAVRGSVGHALSDALIKKEPAVYGKSKEMSVAQFSPKNGKLYPIACIHAYKKLYN